MIYTFFIFLHLCTFSVTILSQRSSAAHYQYEACLPANCGKGPNISFPFHVKGLQESYCGYPGLELSCSDEFPVLRLSEDDEYVVHDITYKNKSFRAFNAAVLRLNGGNCVPRLRNVTLVEVLQLRYVNETRLRLFYGCRNLSVDLSRLLREGCGDRIKGSLALYDGDANVGSAMEKCEENVVVPVDGGSVGILDVDEVLRRGFVMKWRASDCGDCSESGGRCGFNETSYHFLCFCPDRPHLRRCIFPGKIDE